MLGEGEVALVYWARRLARHAGGAPIVSTLWTRTSLPSPNEKR